MAKQIEDLAAKGRALREARLADQRRREARKEARRQASEARWQRHIDALETYAAQRSLTPLALLNIVGPRSRLGRLILASLALLLCGAMALADLRGWLSAAALTVGPIALLALLPSLLGSLASALATASDQRWRAGLPFAVDGYQLALSVTRSYPSDRLFIHFAGRQPPLQLVRDLCELVKTPTTLKIEDQGFELEVKSETGSKFDGYRAWFPRWFRDATTKVLLPLHREYPIRAVVFPE